MTATSARAGADWKSRLIRIYADSGAAKSGSFRLSSGGTSDFYIDGRMVTTRPDGLEAIVEGMREILEPRGLLRGSPNLVGPAVSGIPIATALSMALLWPFVIDRGTAKQHGMGKRFEGAFNSSPACVIVDDLITAGGTLLKCVEGLREIGKTVAHAVIVVDRQEGGPELLASHGVRVHALVTKDELKAVLSAVR